MSGTLSIGGKEIFSHSDITDKVSMGADVKNIFKSGTAVTIPSSGGSATYDFSIPSGVKYVALLGRDISHSTTTTNISTRLGTSNGINTTGYTGVGGYFGSTSSIDNKTDRFMLFHSTGGSTIQDAIWEFYNLNNNEWMCKGIGNYGTFANFIFAMSNGHIDLGGELTTVQIIASAGVFDSGFLNILYA